MPPGHPPSFGLQQQGRAVELEPSLEHLPFWEHEGWLVATGIIEVVNHQAIAAATIARADRSMSASVVRQLETEMRMRRWPCQVVDPIQHSPDRCTASMTRSVVASSSPNRTSTWFRTTLLTTAMPSTSSSWVAKRRAKPQHRSTSSATPLRPSSRSAAHVANPRARRDDSSTKSPGGRTAAGEVPTRYAAVYAIAAA